MASFSCSYTVEDSARLRPDHDSDSRWRLELGGLEADGHNIGAHFHSPSAQQAMRRGVRPYCSLERERH